MLQDEPAVLGGLIVAVLTAALNVLVVVFNVALTDVQLATLNAFFVSVVSLITALVIRANVTPTASPSLPVGTEVNQGNSIVVSKT
jgi:membrane protein implicated in regulation of membrane protease activity